MTQTADLVVAGGGVIGSAIAWRAASAGLGVVLVDPGSGDAASQVAAGMLAPVSESLFGEDELLRLNLLAIARFPTFADELEAAAGAGIGLRREGTLAVAYDPGDHAALGRLTAFRRSLGLDAGELDSRGCRALEPFLAPDVHGGVLFAGDWSVDNRRYAAALGQAMRHAGVRTVPGRVTGVLVRDGKAHGVRVAPAGTRGEDATADAGATAAGGGGAAGGGDSAAGVQEITCGAVLVAAGYASGAIDGLPASLRAAVRPVKGQLLRLRLPTGMPPVIGHTVRATVRGRDIYLVPRADGELVIGATSEERGPDRTVTAGAVHDLLHDAMSVLPVTSELVLTETSAGLRPATPDNGPIVGATGIDGLLVATGHYRNGILLSPITADAAVAVLTGRPPAPEWAPFAPGRFMEQVSR